MKHFFVVVLALFTLASPKIAYAASVKPDDLITPDNASMVQDLVSPGNFYLVRQGMRMKIVPTGRLEWPPPYKAATEKYSSQVGLNDQGELQNFVAGQPFPSIDPNDPHAATKAMWNFSFRPQSTDDADIRDVEIVSWRPSSALPGPIEHFTIGHFAFYNNMGRTEVNPVPTDPEATGAGIRYRFGGFPFLEPEEIRGGVESCQSVSRPQHEQQTANSPYPAMTHHHRGLLGERTRARVNAFSRDQLFGNIWPVTDRLPRVPESQLAGTEGAVLIS